MASRDQMDVDSFHKGIHYASTSTLSLDAVFNTKASMHHENRSQQKLHASPHIEHIPILSIYIHIWNVFIHIWICGVDEVLTKNPKILDSEN